MAPPLAPWFHMVGLAGGGALAAAGEPAAAVPGDHGAAQVIGDGLGRPADVQRQAHRARGAVEQAGAQERGQPGRAGQQIRGMTQDHPPHRGGLRGPRPVRRPVRCSFPAQRRVVPAERRVAEERGGELVQDGRVDVPGHDRHDHRVTLAARRRGRPARRPRRFGVTGAVEAAQLIQGHVQLDLRRLPRPVRRAARRDQLPACLFQPVMVTLAHSAGVLRAGLLAERVQHRVQRGGARRGQVTVDPARAVQGAVQPQPPIREPAIARRCRARRSGGASPPPARPGPPAPRRPPRRPAESIGVRLLAFGELGGPGADLPRPRRRNLPGRQRVPDGGWAASRRAQPTAPAAAPLVTRVCHRSHARAEPCPSSSNRRRT